MNILDSKSLFFIGSLSQGRAGKRQVRQTDLNTKFYASSQEVCADQDTFPLLLSDFRKDEALEVE